MKLLHGSPVHGIEKFNLDNRRFQNYEGTGVYLTDDYAVARHFAGSEGAVYEVEVKGAVFDGTSKEEWDYLISKLSKAIDFDLSALEGLEETLEGLMAGQYQITNEDGYGFNWQLRNLLDADEAFMEKEDSEELLKTLESTATSYFEEYDVLKYKDKKIGIVHLVKNPDLIKVKKEIVIGSDEDVKRL